MSQTRQYLNIMVSMENQCGAKFPCRYGGVATLIASEGLDMGNMGEMPKGHKRGRMKECFMNAFHLVIKNPKRFIYCEGYALSIIPTFHAWVWDNEAKCVVDPTWTKGSDYVGIPFTYRFCATTIAKRGYYGVIEDFENHFPLITRLDMKAAAYTMPINQSI